MDHPKYLLLITTTAEAISKHLPHETDRTVPHWLMDGDRCVALWKAHEHSWPEHTVLLIDESVTPTDDEEDFILDHIEDRVICWVYHQWRDDFVIPTAHPCFHFHEYSREGSVVEFFHRWNYADGKKEDERRTILKKYLDDSREQALENYRRTYLNTYTDAELQRLGEKFSRPAELNHAESLLLDRHPELSTHLAAVDPNAPPEMRHYQRLSIARYFYEKR